MTRYHTTAAGNIPFTAEEEVERDAEEAANAATAARASILAQIANLERESMLNRGSRELELRLMEKEAAEMAASLSTPEVPVTMEQVLASVPYYAKVKALDDQITALRVQL